MNSTVLLAARLHNNPLSKFNQFRYRRPTLRIAKEKFELSVDLRQFNKDEIKVKSNPQYLLIEGKHEKQNKDGEIYVIRQFVRKFKLPEGTIMDKITSILTSEGILTVSAPRELVDDNNNCNNELEVPITFGGSAVGDTVTESKNESKTKCGEKDR